MQLIEDEKPQSLRRPHQLPVFASSEQQFQHHVVREQDVRRRTPYLVPQRSFLLARVPREPNQGSPFRIASVDELPELLVLAVGEGVHGVDDDGLDSAAGTVSKHVVHDRHHVGEALPGTGAGGQNAGLTCMDLENRLALVLVQEELLAAMVRV